MKKKETIAVVLDEELIDFLKAIDMYDSLLEGKLSCSKCRRQIDENNLLVIIPKKNNQIEFICDEPACLESFNRGERPDA